MFFKSNGITTKVPGLLELGKNGRCFSATLSETLSKHYFVEFNSSGDKYHAIKLTNSTFKIVVNNEESIFYANWSL